MKTHFGAMENWGDYESPMYGCEETLCGETGEMPVENSTDDWDLVDCKRCLRLKDQYIEGCKEDEKSIIHQMGEMADFWEKEMKKEVKNETKSGI